MKRCSFLAATLLVAACSQIPEIENSEENRVEAQVFGGIGNTRVAVGSDTWEANDQIGVTAVSEGKSNYTNVPYTFDSGTSFRLSTGATPIYFRDDKKVRFTAYYPYSNNLTEGSIPITEPIDYMFASGVEADKDHNTVAFTQEYAFKHMMSLVKFEFYQGNDISITSTSFTNVTIENACWKGDFDTSTGKANAKQEPENKNYTPTIFQDTDASPKATVGPLIFIPQQLNVSLKATVDGDLFTATLSDVKELEPGKSYAFKIKINKTGLEKISANITPWEIVSPSEEIVAE